MVRKSEIFSKSSKKGQMKVQQMAFMLMAVTLFFVLVGMFLLVVVFSDLEQNAELLEERGSLLLASKIANSPEFSCGSAFGTTKTNCIDGDKAMALRARSDKYSDSNFWKVEGIEIRKIYPNTENEECRLDNYPDCNQITIMDNRGSGVGVSTFVSLCRNEDQGEGRRASEQCDLARIIVYYGGDD